MQDRFIERSLYKGDDVTNSTLHIEINDTVQNLVIIDTVQKEFAENATDIDLEVTPEPAETKWIEENPVLLTYYGSVAEDIEIYYETTESSPYLYLTSFEKPEIYVLDVPEIIVEQPPVADFEIDKAVVEVGSTVTFNASSSYDPDGVIETYEWGFGDGVTDTGEVVDHIYTEAGNYTVTLTVTDDDGLTDTLSKTVEVTKPDYVPDEPEPSVNWMPIILAIIVIIVLLLVPLYLYRRKKKNEIPLSGI